MNIEDTLSSADSLEALLARGVRALETIVECMTRTEPYHTAKSVNDQDEDISEIVGRYVFDHQGKFTSIDCVDYEGVQPQIIDTISGACAGRFKKDASGDCSLALPLAVFKVYVSERGIDKNRLATWIKRVGRTEVVRLRAKHSQQGPRCYVLPLDGDRAAELLAVAYASVAGSRGTQSDADNSKPKISNQTLWNRQTDRHLSRSRKRRTC